jgi:putative transposase
MLDRCLWVWLSRLWSGWRSALIMVKPETAIGGIVKDFSCTGPGRFTTADQGVPHVLKETRDRTAARTMVLRCL